MTAYIKGGNRKEAAVLRRRIGRPLVWDVRWRLWGLLLRNRLVPYRLVTLVRELKGK